MLIDAMTDIMALKPLIADLLAQKPPDYIQLTCLQKYSLADENNPELFDSITGTDSEDPVSDLIKALFYFYVDGEESGRLLRRWPGVVVYNDGYPALEGALQQLNKKKTEFKNAVMQYEEQIKKSSNLRGTKLSIEKFDYIHNLFPMLVTLYVYRQVSCLHGPVKAAYWNWQVPPNTRVVDADYIRNSLTDALSATDDPKTKDIIESRISRLNQESNVDWVYRAAQPPRPVLTPHFNDGRPPGAKHGSLPIFIFCQADYKLSYKRLKDFDMKARLDRKPKKRTDAGQYTHYFGDFYARSKSFNSK